MMKYLQWIVLGWICLSPSLYAVTINTTNVPDYPQPPVPNLVEAPTPAPVAREQETIRTLNPAPVEHTVYPTVIDEPPEYEDSETVAFPPDDRNRAAAAADSNVVAASITLTCNPVEYGTPVTTTEIVPVIAIIAAFDPPFAVQTNKTREDTQTTYAMGWLAPDPDKAQNDLTIEGVDVDNDCVRDDVENYIYRKMPGPWNIAKRKYLFEYAKWLGVQLQSSISESTAKTIFNNMAVAGECVNRSLGGSAATEALDDLFAKFHNTFPRSFRYIDNLSQTSGWTTREKVSVSCP